MRSLILKNKVLSEEGESIKLNLKEFNNVSFMVKPDNFSGTIKIATSISEKDKIDFSQPPTKSNPYDTVEVVGISSGKYFDGDIGLQFISDNTVRIFETNSTILNSFAVIVSEVTGGTIEVDLLATD